MSKLGRLSLCGAVAVALTLGLGCKKEEAAEEVTEDAAMATEAVPAPVEATDLGTTEMSTEPMSTEMSTEAPGPQ